MVYTPTMIFKRSGNHQLKASITRPHRQSVSCREKILMALVVLELSPVGADGIQTKHSQSKTLVKSDIPAHKAHVTKEIEVFIMGS